MKTSVMKSLITGSLVVMLLSLLIVTIVFFYNVKLGIETDTYAEMDEFVQHIKPITKMSLDFSTSRMMKLYDETIQQFTHLTKFNLLIVSQNGEVIWSDFPISSKYAYEHVLNVKDELSNGGKIQAENFLSDIYPGNTMTLAESVTGEISNNSCIIFCTVKTPSVMDSFFDIILEILIMELAAILFMAIFLYLFSRNITNPLAKINKSLKAFSKGDFSSRVDYKSSNELGELAENVNSMADGLENLEKMRSSFVSDISHELRTPMTSISGFIEGILDGTIPKSESDRYLGIVLSETKRLSRIINDLLSISKLESGTIRLNRRVFDIQELAKVVLVTFEREISDKNIKVSLSTDSKQSLVYADKDSYTQVLINLIHNAVKFTNQDGVINLIFEETDNKCKITVQNSGDGICDDKINLIWERFYKADSSRSGDKSGVGLGLYIVKRIIDSHDETITVSNDNNLTSFTFTAALKESF